MDDSRQPDKEFDSVLLKFFHSREPDPAFLSQLRASLVPSSRENSRRVPSPEPRLRLGWRHAALAGVLILIAFLAVAGPSRVLAQVEDWIGYIPGLGQVNLAHTRVLAHPVSRTEGSITFDVQQFVASPDETLVKIHLTGLPPGASPSFRSVFVQWGTSNGLRMRKAEVLPSHPTCPPTGCPQVQEPDGFDMLLSYEPLPDNVQAVRLIWQVWGIVPGSLPSASWVLELPLVPREDRSGLSPSAYAPLGAVDTHFGIQVRVDQVIPTNSGLVIDSVVLVPPSVDFPSPERGLLTTDTGRQYLPGFANDLDMNPIPVQTVPVESPAGTALTRWPFRWQFQEVDNQAAELTLSIDRLNVTYPITESFDVEVDQDPPVGTVIPLDVSLRVDGFSIHINQARVVMATATWQGGTGTVKALEFHIDSPSVEGGRNLRAIWFAPHYNQGDADPTIDPGTGISIGRLTWNPKLIRSGEMTVTVDRLEMSLQGPWVLTWDLPGASVPN